MEPTVEDFEGLSLVGQMINLIIAGWLVIFIVAIVYVVFFMRPARIRRKRSFYKNQRW